MRTRAPRNFLRLPRLHPVTSRCRSPQLRTFHITCGFVVKHKATRPTTTLSSFNSQEVLPAQAPRATASVQHLPLKSTSRIVSVVEFQVGVGRTMAGVL